MKKAYLSIVLLAALGAQASTAMAQQEQERKTGVAMVVEHFTTVSAAEIDQNYFLKLRNTMDGDIKALEQKLTTADAATKVQLEKMLAIQKAVRQALQKKIDTAKDFTKTQLLKFATDFQAK